LTHIDIGQSRENIGFAKRGEVILRRDVLSMKWHTAHSADVASLLD